MQLKLDELLNLINKMPAYRELLGKLRGDGAQALSLEAAKPYLIAALYLHLRLPVLVVTAQPQKAKRLYEQIAIWSGSSAIKLFPEPDSLPYQRTITDSTTEQARLEVLFTLSRELNPLVIASAPALMQKTVAQKDFVSACHTVETSMNVDPLQLLKRWEATGYRVENTVEVPGTVSRRGGIVDIYPPASDLPARLDFLGNTIESIRLFDPATQRSVRTTSSIAVCPATELLVDKSEFGKALKRLDLSACSPEARERFERELTILAEEQRTPDMAFYAPLFNNGCLLDYLPANGLLVLDEMAQIREEMKHLDAEAIELREDKLRAGELPSNFPRPYFAWEELDLSRKQTLGVSAWDSPGAGLERLGFASAPSYAGQLPTFIQKVKEMVKRQNRLIIVSNQASRLSELFAGEDVIAQPVAEIKEVPPAASLTLVQGFLSEGWVMQNTHLFTDSEIFGFVKESRLPRKHATRHKLLFDLVPGDYVVHIEHGIGKFGGVINMSTDSTQREYLVLTYAAGDKLYVPTEQIDRISRYIGAAEHAPTLSRLGTQEWAHARQKVKKAVEEIAEDLLKLYASRQTMPGYAFSPDTVWQSELEAAFPYVETPDQIKVQAEVKADMSQPKPMDRLVCGDVGYGKTEIAIRAAFKAVMDGKQVAVLVPTTVLAQQHYDTFKQRLSSFPVRVEVLSRFRTRKEQQTVLTGLANGSVDIVIGTHRLLQKDVVFKDLGLLIIDEEQRFGVAHKEHLKKLRQEVDVLTLSATPIPRTLHMSLVGVRDMSVMETPPEDRLPIKTYVAGWNDQLVREAILREMERNGQVFFVHNRVQGIAVIAARLQALVPEARLAVAHGQMPEEKLERVMTEFARGESDVLVCTTIIESGLDMPNVNTLIVNRADRFGLTQLYQLRGRVGRGANLAYAYLLYDHGNRLTPTAEKRLQTIFEATELGAGYSIAMKDLEIRGAGT
ncbi:MAG: transcription-repair coupling factor, partial [Dehalococcoidia bacterium]|nr:transcription-repair coupling factor [Dehalococcoidia bacterium]